MASADSWQPKGSVLSCGCDDGDFRSNIYGIHIIDLLHLDFWIFLNDAVLIDP